MSKLVSDPQVIYIWYTIDLIYSIKNNKSIDINIKLTEE